jgi:hypothetical protein
MVGRSGLPTPALFDEHIEAAAEARRDLAVGAPDILFPGDVAGDAEMLGAEFSGPGGRAPRVDIDQCDPIDSRAGKQLCRRPADTICGAGDGREGPYRSSSSSGFRSILAAKLHPACCDVNITSMQCQ